jgi:hypothetical protein
MDRDEAFAISAEDFRPLMENLNKTTNEDGTFYWHIQLTEAPSGDISLLVPKRTEDLNLSKFALELKT